MVPSTIGREERDDVGTVPIVGNGGRRPPTPRLGALTMALEVKAIALACACQIRSHLINAKMTPSFVRRCRRRTPPRQQSRTTRPPHPHPPPRTPRRRTRRHCYYRGGETSNGKISIDDAVRGLLTVEIFDQTLPQLVKKTLVYTSLNASDVTHHVLNVKDQDWVRSCLEIRGLVTFVPDGAVLPRKSGADDEPMNDKSADNGVSDSTQPLVRFLSPDTLRVTFDLPNMKRARRAKRLLDWAVSANLVPRVIFDPPNDDGYWTNDPTSRSPNSICVNIVETYLLPAAYGGAGGVEVRARAADTIIVDDEDDDNDDHDRHRSTSWGDDDRVALAKRRAIDYSVHVRAVADATRAMNKMRRMHINYPEHSHLSGLPWREGQAKRMVEEGNAPGGGKEEEGLV